MAEWMITGLIQGIGLVFMAGMVYKGHTRMERDLDSKADAAVTNLRFEAHDDRISGLEEWRNQRRPR